jgi:hypothetical protein
MVTSTQRLVTRYKNAGWTGVGDDLHQAIDTAIGKWVVFVKMTTGDHQIHRYYVGVTVPEDAPGGSQTLKAPGGDYRTQAEAKKEADIWVRDLKKNGRINLTGWKTVKS